MTRPRSRPLLGFGQRLYRLGLLFLPADFRRRYGRPMLDTFRDRCRAADRRGRLPLLVAQLRGLFDLLKQAAAERLDPLSGRPRGSSSHPLPREPVMLHRDLRYAVRAAMRRPVFAGATVLTFAIAIGVSGSIFSAVNGVLLQPLPYPDPDGLVILGQSSLEATGELEVTSAYVVSHIARTADSLAGAAIFRYWEGVLTGIESPRRLAGEWVSGNYLDLIGVRPLLGRTFAPGDPERAVVLGHALWESAFGADPTILGTSIVLDGEQHRVLGVMPPGFESPGQYVFSFERADLWVRMRGDTAAYLPEAATVENRVLRGVGRLREDADPAALEQELVRARASVADEFPQWSEDSRPVARPVRELALRSVRPTLLALAGAMALLLLLACSNLMSLSLGRRIEQAPELAVRTALGAGRGALVRQALLEGLILATVGCGLGLVIASASNGLLLDALPAGVPRADQIRVDTAVVACALAASWIVSAAASLLSCLPLLRRERVERFVRQGSPSSRGPRTEGSQAVFAVVQVGIAVALVIGTSLLLRSFAHLLDRDPGYRPTDVLAAQIDMPVARYETPGVRLRLADDLAAAVSDHTVVDAAGYVTSVPRHGMNDLSTGISISGIEPEEGNAPWAHFRAVSPGYREAAGLELVEGRFLQAGDGGPESGTAAVVNRELVRRFISDGDVLGRTLGVFGQALRIVGVVEPVQYGWPGDEPVPEVYVPFQGRFTTVYLLVRGNRGIGPVATALRQEIQRLDPLIPVHELLDLEKLARISMARERFALLLSGFLASFALLLAIVGVYGIVSYGVRRRVHEIGVRMALGATRARVRRMVLAHGLRLGAVGTVLGLLLAWLGSRYLASLLYGVEPRDPSTYAGVTIGLLALTVAAAWLPARKATRVEPAATLRSE